MRASMCVSKGEGGKDDKSIHTYIRANETHTSYEQKSRCILNTIRNGRTSMQIDQQNNRLDLNAYLAHRKIVN